MLQWEVSMPRDLFSGGLDSKDSLPEEGIEGNGASGHWREATGSGLDEMHYHNDGELVGAGGREKRALELDSSAG